MPVQKYRYQNLVTKVVSDVHFLYLFSMVSLVTDGHCLEEGKTYHLQDLAYLRSGDKGDSANIG